MASLIATHASLSPSPGKETRLKVVVVGDGASGKTSLITRYTQDYYEKQYDQTIGIDFFNKRIDFEGGKSTLLQIWDIGGQTLGGFMLDKYLFGTDIVLFVYDVTNRSSFDNIQDWLTSVEAIVSPEDCHFVLVGNKVDLEHLRVVPRKEHERTAKELSMWSFLVSAKTGELINVMFKRVAAHKLRIKLTRSELEATSVVVKANVTEAAEASSSSGTGTASAGFPPSGRMKRVSKICVLQ